MSERLTPEELGGLLPEAKANERRQRALTNDEASEDTEKVFEQQETQRIIEESNPDNPLPHEVEEQDETLSQFIRGQEAAQEARRIAGVSELPEKEIQRRIQAMRARMGAIDPEFEKQNEGGSDKE